MAREHRILSRLPDALPATPRSLHFCEDPAILGVPFQLLEYRAGRVIRAILPDDLASRAPELAETMLTTLASIHAVDTDALGLDTLGRPEGYLARQRTAWYRRGTAVAADNPATLTLIEELAAWLDAHPAPDTPPTLLHGDFKLDDLILDETLRLNAIVDWDQGTRGDPLFDLATLLSYWTEPNDPPEMHALQQMPTASPGFPTREQAVHHYARLTGRDVSDFRHHRVLALLKLAVISLQLGALSRIGAMVDLRYAGFTAVGTGVLGFAREVAGNRAF